MSPNWRQVPSLNGGKSNAAITGCLVTGIRGSTLNFLIQALTAREVRKRMGLASLVVSKLVRCKLVHFQTCSFPSLFVSYAQSSSVQRAHMTQMHACA